MASVTLNLNVWEETHSATNNTSDIGWNLSVTSVNAVNGYDNQCPYIIRYNDSSGSVVASGNKGFANNTTTQLASGTITGYKHNEDGSGSITLYAHYTTGVNPETAETTITIPLTTIDRAVKITKFEATNITKNSVTLVYETDAEIDYAKYSLNNGEFVNLPINDTITGLECGTTYSIRIQLKRKYTDLWTTSEAIEVTTLSDKKIRLKKDSIWKETLPYIKINGSWKEAKPYIKVNGVWKEGV